MIKKILSEDLQDGIKFRRDDGAKQLARRAEEACCGGQDELPVTGPPTTCTSGAMVSGGEGLGPFELTAETEGIIITWGEKKPAPGLLSTFTLQRSR